MGILNFVLGTAAVDHQKVLVDRLAEELADHPHDRFFYIVPNHIKFNSEVSVLSELQKRQGLSGTYAQSQVQILSLSRLAWYLLRDTGTYQAESLSTVGANMLMTSIVQQHQGEMGMYANEVKHAGFIGHLTSQVNQLMAANIEPDDLRKVADAAPKNQQGQSWVERLRILANVEEWYGQRTSGYLSTLTEYRKLISELQRQDFSDCHFFFDRFTQFTATELAVVKAMIVNGQETTISLILDKAYRRSKLPAVNSLFYTSGRQYARLWRFAQQNDQVTVKADLRATQPRVNDDLKEVEKAMIAAAQFGVDQPTALQDTKAVQCFTAADRTAELKQVITKIHQLVASGKYRYRDILVLTRHLANYANVIEPLFAQQNVPVFNDHEKQMTNHPLVVLIRQLFQLVKGGFQTETIMALLKTGLLIPQKLVLTDVKNGEEKVLSVEETLANPDLTDPQKRRQAVNKTQSRMANIFMNDVFVTENWCLKYGINEGDWLSKKPWDANFNNVTVASEAYKNVLKIQTDSLNRVKDYVNNVLRPFVDQLSGARSDGSRTPQQMSGRHFATVLYQFLTADADVTTQLKRWARGMAHTDLAGARQSQQVWQELCNLLDQFVDVLGDDTQLTPQEFGEVLNNGMQAATYSQIPSTLDQVLISETGIIQDNHRKVVFIIGATDDEMPETKKSSGLLNDAEIERINDTVGNDRYLPQSASSRLKNEPFLAYLAMLMGCERLIMSAPLVADAEDTNGLDLSPYLIAVAKHFGMWDEEANQLVAQQSLVPDGGDDFDQVKSFVGTPESTVGPLLRVIRQAKEDQESISERRKTKAAQEELALLGNAWAEVGAALINLQASDKWQQEFNHLMTGLYYSNQPTKLAPALATALYTVSNGDDQRILRSSISALQTYYRNPYQYFLQFGLGLNERDQMEIKPSNTGTFFHDSLAHLVNGQSDLASVGDQELMAAVEQANHGALENQKDLQRYINKYNRFKFQLGQMEDVVQTMAFILRLQANNMDAKPFVTEQPFGSGADRQEGDAKVQDLNPLSLNLAPLTKGGKTIKQQLVLRGRIDRIDKLTTGDQFLVVDYKSSDHPFNLANAIGGIDLQILTYLSAIKDQLKTLDKDATKPTVVGANYLHLHKLNFDYPFKPSDLLKTTNYQFHGVLDRDDQVLSGLAKDYNFFGFSTNAKGNVREKSGSVIVDPAEFDELLKLNQQNLTSAANDILAGEISLAPYRKISGGRQETGLDNSAYADIFRFDNVLDQDLYRDLETDEKVLKEKLKKGDK